MLVHEFDSSSKTFIWINLLQGDLVNSVSWEERERELYVSNVFYNIWDKTLKMKHSQLVVYFTEW